MRVADRYLNGKFGERRRLDSILFQRFYYSEGFREARINGKA